MGDEQPHKSDLILLNKAWPQINICVCVCVFAKIYLMTCVSCKNLSRFLDPLEYMSIMGG